MKKEHQVRAVQLWHRVKKEWVPCRSIGLLEPGDIVRMLETDGSVALLNKAGDKWGVIQENVRIGFLPCKNPKLFSPEQGLHMPAQMPITVTQEIPSAVQQTTKGDPTGSVAEEDAPQGEDAEACAQVPAEAWSIASCFRNLRLLVQGRAKRDSASRT